MYKNQSNLLKFVGAILILVTICALVMMLVKGDFRKAGTTVGNDSPQVSTSKQPDKIQKIEFNDGLGVPDNETHGTLDEFGAGIEDIAEFYLDINDDNTPDKITRTHIATGNDHDYHEYKIELNVNGVMVNITPNGFRTTKGADCALRLIKFNKAPKFNITVISRPFQDTWDTPSGASKNVYVFQQNKIVKKETDKLGVVCDVADLF